MFTDRYFEIPIRIFDKSDNETYENLGLRNDQKSMMAIAKILPLQIESYRESIETDLKFTLENKKSVMVYMKSGDTYMVGWTIAEFEKRLNKFEEEVII